ncbi:MAG: hypothetical protein GXO31_03140 [Epsilonproteobacteria bacterium]|nr:hypothetical protein [Campylobacterota bacterium]
MEGVKKLLLIGAFPIFLFSSESNFNYLQSKDNIVNSFFDSDLDGVADVYDECPDTPFLEIVDSKGCSKNQTPKSLYYISLSAGYIYTERKYYDMQRGYGFKNGAKKHHQKSKSKKSYKEVYIPTNIFVNFKNWIYSLTVGYIRIKDRGKEIESGLADTYFSLGYLFDLRDRDLPIFTLKGKVKIPTSDISSERDYTIEGNVYKSLGKTDLFADVGYTAMGSFKGYKNIYYFDLDLSRSFKKFNFGAVYSFNKNTHNDKSIQNGTLYLYYHIDEKTRVYLGYTRDFFDSRDYKSIALTLSRNF